MQFLTSLSKETIVFSHRFHKKLWKSGSDDTALKGSNNNLIYNHGQQMKFTCALGKEREDMQELIIVGEAFNFYEKYLSFIFSCSLYWYLMLEQLT